jgi:hypothetical protein
VPNANPPLTGADVAGEPICVAPLNNVNVTVPPVTPPPPAGAITDAVSETFWLERLNVPVPFTAAVVVDAGVIVSVCAVSVLAEKFVEPL